MAAPRTSSSRAHRWGRSRRAWEPSGSTAFRSGGPGLVLGGFALLLVGGVVGLYPSVDVTVSLQKLAVMVVAAALTLGLGRISLRGQRSMAWALIALALLASLVGNVLVDRASWKLDGLNRPVYALFAHVPRFTDLAFSQNGLAAVLVLAIPFGVALAVRRGPARAECMAGLHELRGSRVAAVVVVALLAGELLVTESRAAMLSLGLASVLFGVYLPGRRRWLGLLVPVAVAALVASGLVALPISLSWQPTGGSSAERLAIWQSSLLMIADMPLTGIGLGMFQRVYPLYIMPAYTNIHPHAHNLFLQTYLDAGPLGCVGMLLLAWGGLVAAVRLWRNPPSDPLRRALGAGAAVSCAAVFLHAQVDSYFAGDPRTYFLMFVPFGLLLAAAPPALRRPWSKRWLALALLPAVAPTPMTWALLWTNAGSVERLKSELVNPSHRIAAAADFRRALQAEPGLWVAERGLGLLDLESGNATGSSAELMRAIAHGAPGSRVHVEIADALFASGRTPAAVEQWRFAGAAPALVRRALRETHADRQRAGLELALRVDPSDAAAYVALAELDFSQGHERAAKVALRARLALHGGDGDASTHVTAATTPRARLALKDEDDEASRAYAHLLLGLAAHRLGGDPAAALAELRAAVRENSGDEALHRALGLVLEDDGRHAEAEAATARADALVRSGRPSDTLGRAYAALGENSEAAAEYERVAAGPKPDPIGDYDLGELALGNGRPRLALLPLQLAVEAIPNQEDFRLALARAYLAAGAFADANREYRAVLALDPGSAEARRACAALARVAPA